MFRQPACGTLLARGGSAEGSDGVGEEDPQEGENILKLWDFSEVSSEFNDISYDISLGFSGIQWDFDDG